MLISSTSSCQIHADRSARPPICSLSDALPVQVHDWFAMNTPVALNTPEGWQKLYNKELTPPYTPQKEEDDPMKKDASADAENNQRERDRAYCVVS